MSECPVRLVERVGVTVPHRFGDGPTVDVAQPVTLTPFASARPCSARCVFCSETLIHREARVLSASLRPSKRYHQHLAACLLALRGLPFGVSLSGLEATDDVDWLCATLDALDEHARASPVGDRVLYTNGSGLSPRTTGTAVVARLERFCLTRTELSRHALDQEANQAIMRFRDGAPVASEAGFAEALRFTAARLPVRLSCVVQQGGVACADDAARYLDWASSLGVRDVVFRELSRTGDLYRPTPTLAHSEARRVSIDALTAALPGDCQPVEQTHGYYFESLRCAWRGCAVTFEHSDYTAMKAHHASGVVHKLVFHANGNLCADWDPESTVLWRPVS